MKKIIFATFLFILATSTNAFAHTHLGSSSPEDGQEVTEELSEITLNFEGKIEQSSSFELSNEGQNIPIENITIEEGIMTGTMASPLENGEYLVNWSIIGADGHLMEGDYSFTVNVPDSVSSTEAANEQAEQETTQEVEQSNEQATEEATEEAESNEETSPLIPVIMIVLIAVIIGAFLLMRRKK
ncbi:copper resistance protein CopC [Lysinibacillus sp. SGAir0095]|uniref:copper resistance CopC family protein n=1 Tax=Lysinibacillus sp. SGAir0095 TaxID=2070463 RepID=UPI0010CCB79D|nr:copper resistance protein CopC [Lysinibacillus sp. SGAir0095]QCR34121.1 hypothetical protein C1N55_19210 [Lysinibacillus sp. SGAir0095]